MSIAYHIPGLSPNPCYRHLLQRLLQWLPTNWSSYTITLLQHSLYIATWVTFSKAVWCWKHHYKHHHWLPTNHKLKFKIIHVDYEVLQFWPLPTFEASSTSFYLVLCSPTPLTPAFSSLSSAVFFYHKALAHAIPSARNVPLPLLTPHASHIYSLFSMLQLHHHFLPDFLPT